MFRATASCNFFTSGLQKVVRAWCALCILTLKCASCHSGNFSTSELQKVVRAWCVLCILTLKCASRHSGMQFFHICRTSKSGPSMVCFVHFDFETATSAPAALASLLFDPADPQIMIECKDHRFVDVLMECQVSTDIHIIEEWSMATWVLVTCGTFS